MTTASRRQRGAALLALLAVIMLGAAWWLLSAIQPVNRVVLERQHNAKILREAKRAVLGWVAQNATDRTDFNPGKLPCPEALGNFTVPPSVNEGTMQGFCAGAVAAAVGRLPWKSLGIDKPFDADGEVLWYVVGPGWKVPNSPETPLGINSNSPNTLFVDGSVNPQAVAAIVAPGKRLVTTPIASQTAQGCSAQTQARDVFPPLNANGYLECQNVAGASLRTGVVDNSTSPAFNDQVVLITAADVLDAIEPIVAARIQRDVVPHLQSDYVNSSWGGTAAEPYFPFAVAYPSSGTFNPTTSDFKGVLATAQGLLPMTATTCNALTAGRCDATFIQWNTATASATQISSTQPLSTFTANCAASSATQIQCTIDYDMVLCLGSCAASANVQVQATASNVARAVRNLDPSAASGLTSPTFTAPMQPNGSVIGTYTGTIEATNILGIPGLCGTLIGLLCHGNATVTIPIGVFQEQLVNPATSDNWYWFTANNWHHVTYFAIASPNVPGGARNCIATSNCLDVAFDVGTSLTTKRAILALAGRSVTGTTGSDRALNDFLDTAVNVDFNSTFQQKRASRSGIAGSYSPQGAFNDRFVSITP